MRPTRGLSTNDELRPKNLDVAAFVLVHAVEALTHTAVVEHPELLEDDVLTDEFTDLILRYMID
jgi:hypothetical protein